MNPIPCIDTYFLNILILSSKVCLGLPRSFISVGFPVKVLKALLHSSILATGPAHINILDLSTLTILIERYTLSCSSLWSLLHFLLNPIPRPFSQFWPNLFMQCKVVILAPNPQTGRPLLIGCGRYSQLIFKYGALLPNSDTKKTRHTMAKGEKILSVIMNMEGKVILNKCYRWLCL